MAIKIFLALAALVGVMWYLSWYGKAPPERRNRSLITILLYTVAAALLLLVVTGRISWLFALFSAAAPWINRMLVMRQAWNWFNRTRGASSGGPSPGQPGRKMSAAEALEILGLEPGASEQEIVAAHKKLIQKIHPDRGGSDYLAARINEAKETLLDA